MFGRYMNFIKALSVSRLGRVGIILTTSSFITFMFLEAAQLAGIITNAYIGLITFLFFPALFIIGLILIPIAWHVRRRQTGKSTRELMEERFDPSDRARGFFGSRVFISIAIFSIVNILFLAVAASRMLHFMDSSHFCGTACHSVMSPEWVTYQQSPHARVKCVECHVGEGVGNLIDSKINGMHQMLSVTFNLYERPIPTPVHTLRPSRETCEKCHWPAKFYGQRLRTFTHYQDDEESTPYYTSIIQKVDAGKAGKRAGIHWHIGEENQVRYASIDDERKEMIWVEVRRPDGSFKRYVNQTIDQNGEVTESGGSSALMSSEVRLLDCIDCHNRATHIYEDPEKALDLRLEQGLIDRSLPFIKREALAALTSNYPDANAAMTGIENHLHGFYRRGYPGIAGAKRTEIENAVAVLQAVYRRNIHHEMNIQWNTYASLLGHAGDEGGCFRCHTSDLVDSDGHEISNDCTLCHSILAYEEDEPFAYVLPPDSTAKNFAMHSYLQDEFVFSYRN